MLARGRKHSITYLPMLTLTTERQWRWESTCYTCSHESGHALYSFVCTVHMEDFR